jgi:MazG family protein
VQSSDALRELDALTRRLRAECPWDREQDERSIVPHTVEEAYELADAAERGDDAKLLDELGDVLFQVHFLALLLEERGAGDLAAVADQCRHKLIRRHPHVFDHVEVAGSDDVLRNWDAIKANEAGREEGIFGEVPENLPALLHARKLQRRVAASGFDPGDVEEKLAAVGGAVEALVAARADRKAAFAAIGDLLFAAVNAARALRVDPELALRASSDRFRAAIERSEAQAARDGRTWQDLAADEQLALYASARLAESTDSA